MKTIEFYKTRENNSKQEAYWRSLEQIYNLLEHANKYVDAWYCDGFSDNPNIPTINYLEAVIESYNKVEVEYLQNGEKRDLWICKKEISLLDVDETIELSNEFSYVEVSITGEDKKLHFSSIENAYNYVINKYKGKGTWRFIGKDELEVSLQGVVEKIINNDTFSLQIVKENGVIPVSFIKENVNIQQELKG
ncbi:MAG: hypothetical protein E7035_08395 [Verrucomicrobiaceae bacterium]|nr:hypothetical protein [Verrucomicrobiaceae bacterium]